MVGTVLNGLSHLYETTKKIQFLVGLFRGLSGNLNEKSKAEFAQEVEHSNSILFLGLAEKFKLYLVKS